MNLKNFLDNCKKYAPVTVRIGLSIIFIWFSLSQIKSPSEFTHFLPLWTSNFPFSGITLIYMNAGFELVLGILMFLGIFTRTVSLLLSLHLFAITISLGYNAIAVRDLGLAIATFSTFLNGPDFLCLDYKETYPSNSLEMDSNAIN